MIVTCAFREPYLTHNTNQLSALSGFPVLSFRDCLPYSEGIVRQGVKERFQQSLYGFKPHAIQQALGLGYRHIVWMDPSVMPLEPIETIFEQLSKVDMLVIPGHAHINKMTSQKAFDYFGVNPDVNHIGGTIYAFNFNHEATINAFMYWKQAEMDGIFGNQDEFMKGHWADESCMALSMAKAGVEQKYLQFKYKNQKDG
jgi:hypothetical protein